MKRLSWAVLGVLAAASFANFGSFGCGSESATVDDSIDGGDEASGSEGGSDDASSDTGSADAFIDKIADGGRDPDSATCKATGTACVKSTECCTTNCNQATGKCATPTGLCKLPGTACATGNECCTFSCIGGTCADKLCVADNQACGSDNECCGGKCAPNGVGGGTCTPLNGSGPATGGNPCTQNSQCASQYCQNGVCTASSFCGQVGDVCSSGAGCCGGTCTIAAGAKLGICAQPPAATGVGSCNVAGTVCAQTMPPAVCGGSCCSRSCAPYGPTGVDVCQPESGCKVTGDICTKNDDCCGAPGAPGSVKIANNGNPGPSANVVCSIPAGSTVGRCANPGVCRPAGDTCRLATVSCNAPDDCCAGNVQQHPLDCQQDALGIPRCMVVRDFNCANGTPPPGTACASSADCCGHACAPNPAGGQPAFICSASCIGSGGTCSSTSDCCPGLPCAIAPGGTKGVCGGVVLTDGGVTTDGGGPVTQDGGTAGDGGVCALYGQQCATATDCCASVPCTNGTCHFP